MDFFLNELSLHNQFTNLQDFLSALQNILKCKDMVDNFGFRFYCKKTVSTQPVFNGSSFEQGIRMTGNPNIIRIFMIWISKNGPFMEDWREHSPDDYLFLKHNDEILTDYSLGEAAFRIATKRNASTVSFQPSDFQMTPILVVWDRLEDQLPIQVPNFWEFNTLENILREQRPPVTSWVGLLNRVMTDVSNLTLIESVSTRLTGEPFNSVIAERVMELLNILNQLAICFDEQGNRTVEGDSIINNFFRRKEALFSDSSDTEKRDFAKDMTFTKSDGEQIFCPYHGKIRHGVFRVHFSWPIRHNEPIYIAYIGPKITKR